MDYPDDFDHDDVERLGEETLWSGFFSVKRIRIRHRLFRGGWSDALERELFVRNPVVGVLLYDPIIDAVALQRQIRVGALDDSHSPWQLEIVAGIIEPGESKDDVARREALEEAGVAPSRLIPIHEYLPSSGGCNELVSAYCGITDLAGVGGVFGVESENEDILVQVFSTDAAFALLDQGQIRNALTIIALQWLRLNIAGLRREYAP